MSLNIEPVFGGASISTDSIAIAQSLGLSVSATGVDESRKSGTERVDEIKKYK